MPIASKTVKVGTIGLPRAEREALEALSPKAAKAAMEVAGVPRLRAPGMVAPLASRSGSECIWLLDKDGKR